MQRLVQTGTLGRLVRIRVSEGNRSTGSSVDRSYLDDSRQSASGGILSELGCHSLDVALFLTGARSFETQACEFIFDGRVDRKVSATIKLADSKCLFANDGVELNYCVSWLDRQTNTITLQFENCTIWAGTQPAAQVCMGSPERASEATLLIPAAQAASTANQAFFLQWESFFEGVRTNSESEVSARSALLGTMLIEELYALGRRHA
jgi:predicted dehydrogenase